MDEQSFKKLIDSVQPNSMATKMLCDRIGYNVKDLIFIPQSQFNAPTQELVQMKYVHYQNRVLKIINEINKIRAKKRDSNVKNSIAESIGRISISKFEASEPSSLSKDETFEQMNYKNRVLQNLIFEELQKEKRNAEYRMNQMKHVASPSIKQNTTQSKMTNTKRNKSVSDDGLEQRNQYFITEIKTEERVKELIQKKKQTPKPIQSNDRVKIMKEQQLLNFHIFQQQTLEQLDMKEQKVRNRIKAFKEQLIQRNKQREKEIEEVEMRRQMEEEEQFKLKLMKQCLKLEKLLEQKKEAQKMQEKQQLDKKKQFSLTSSKVIQNIRNQEQSQYLQQKQALENIEDKISTVNSKKQQILSNKSQILQERHRILEEDFKFNKQHQEYLKQKSEEKILQKNRSIKLKPRYQKDQSMSERLYEQDLWNKAKQAQLFFQKDFQTYQEKLRLKQQNQQINLDNKTIQTTQWLKSTLRQEQVEQLIGVEVKPLKIQN